MDCTSNQTLQALLQLVSERAGVTSIGVFFIEAGHPVLRGGTEAFRQDWSRRHGDRAAAVPLEPLREILEIGAACRIDARLLGLDMEFAAIKPIRDGSACRGFILFLSERRRWLGRKAAKILDDAADVLAGVLWTDQLDEASEPEPARCTALGELEPLGGLPTLCHAEALDLIREAGLSQPGACTLIMLDIDRFRAVNEALGAAAGDFVLARTSTRLAQIIGPDETLARLGGDKFLVLSSRTGDALYKLADQLLAAVAAPLSVRGSLIAI